MSTAIHVPDGLEITTPTPARVYDIAWANRGCHQRPGLGDSGGSRWMYCAMARIP